VATESEGRISSKRGFGRNLSNQRNYLLAGAHFIGRIRCKTKTNQDVFQRSASLAADGIGYMLLVRILFDVRLIVFSLRFVFIIVIIIIIIIIIIITNGFQSK